MARSFPGSLASSASVAGKNLLARKLRRGGGNVPVLFRQVFRGEYFLGRAGLQQKAATRGSTGKPITEDMAIYLQYEENDNARKMQAHNGKPASLDTYLDAHFSEQ